jgi:hypothetical protein
VSRRTQPKGQTSHEEERPILILTRPKDTYFPIKIFHIRRREDELNNDREIQLGKTTAHYLQPVISTIISKTKEDLISTNRPPSHTERMVMDLDET